VAVVISEQTGNISVAHQGQLTTNVEPDQLRGMLQQLLTGKGVQEEGLPETKEAS
jgi:hypothetical protein